MKDRDQKSLAHALDWGVLLVVLGGLLAGAMVLDGTSSAVRRQMEPFSWAEERCDGLVPAGSADSAERWACLRIELGKSDLATVGRQLALAATGMLSAALGALLLLKVRYRPQPRSGRVMESSGDGSG